MATPLDEFRALVERLVEESDHPMAAAFGAVCIAAFIQRGDEPLEPLTDDERRFHALIDRHLNAETDAERSAARLFWEEMENADWQTSETKIGKPGITH